MANEMTDWGWYAGPCEDEMTEGPAPTLEAIIEEAKDAEVGFADGAGGEGTLTIHVCRARKVVVKIADYFTNRFDWFVEVVSEDIDDSLCVDTMERSTLGSLPVEDADRLKAMLHAAVEEWQASTEHRVESHMLEDVGEVGVIRFINVGDAWVRHFEDKQDNS